MEGEPNPYIPEYIGKLGGLSLKDPTQPELGFIKVEKLGEISITDGVPIIREAPEE